MDAFNTQFPKPLNSLLLLLGLVLVGALLGSIIGVVIAVLASGVTDMSEVMVLVEGGGQDLKFMRIIQGASSIGIFVLPPLVLSMIERGKRAYMPAGHIKMRWLILVFMISVCSSPFIEWTGKLNSYLSLPEQLAGLEQWMKHQERQMEILTLQLLSDTTYSGLIGNLIVIALIAAVGEELLFRGALQTILIRWFRNPHVAIWVAAIIFSAIHIQFYGFLPRMFLGALFGYMFYWSKNIWLPIFGHFVNNAGVILMTYSYQKQGNTLDSMDYMPSTASYLYFISFVVTIMMLWALYRATRQESI